MTKWWKGSVSRMPSSQGKSPSPSAQVSRKARNEPSSQHVRAGVADRRAGVAVLQERVRGQPGAELADRGLVRVVGGQQVAEDLGHQVVADHVRAVGRIGVHVVQHAVGAHRDGRLAPEPHHLELVLQPVGEGVLAQVDEQLTAGQVVQRHRGEVDEAALVADRQGAVRPARPGWRGGGWSGSGPAPAGSPPSST